MKKPNIVYFFCDELRCDALSCYLEAPAGIETPNINWIAERGTVFEECYCNSPVCVPSRYSILTGLYPETTGVYHNEAARRAYNGKDRFITFPQVLEAEGYRTANFGKMHLPFGVNPFQLHDPQGSKISKEELKLCRDIVATKGIKSPIGGVYPSEYVYPPQTVTENALDWMKAQTEPYMVRISWLQPHTPVVVPEPYASMYSGLDFPVIDGTEAKLSLFERKYIENVNDGLTKEEAHQAKTSYYGLVRWVDDQVGRILAFLREQGTLEDTVLIFGADHGTMLGENHRYAKQTFARWSHRVPLLISYEKKLKSGIRRNDLCENLDLAKTLLRLLDIPVPDQFQGRDLFSDPEPDYVYASIGYGERESYTFPNKKYGKYIDGRGWPRRACIRSRSYRMDMNIQIDGKPAEEEERDIFLADLKNDPLEQYNVAKEDEYRETVRELERRLFDHIRKTEKELD